jgi:hypothetical protein
MAGRSPARFLAPLALLGFVVALFLVISSSNPRGDGGPANTSQPAATATPGAQGRRQSRRRRRVYVVKAGDTPSGIAEKTGVTLEQLEKANPDLDPQLLAPGQRIRIPQAE